MQAVGRGIVEVGYVQVNYVEVGYVEVVDEVAFHQAATQLFLPIFGVGSGFGMIWKVRFRSRIKSFRIN